MKKMLLVSLALFLCSSAFGGETEETRAPFCVGFLVSMKDGTEYLAKSVDADNRLTLVKTEALSIMVPNDKIAKIAKVNYDLAKKDMDERRNKVLSLKGLLPQKPMPHAEQSAHQTMQITPGTHERIVGYVTPSGEVLHRIATCSSGKSQPVYESSPAAKWRHCRKCW